LEAMVEMMMSTRGTNTNSVVGAEVSAALVGLAVGLRVGDKKGEGDRTGVGRVKLGLMEGEAEGVVSVGIVVGEVEGCGDGTGVGKKGLTLVGGLVGTGTSEGEGDGSFVGKVKGLRVLMTGAPTGAVGVTRGAADVGVTTPGGRPVG
jgi:hypothetical protein